MALFGRPSQQDAQRVIAYREWLQRRNPLAIASLVLGIFSLIEMGALLVFGIAGIVLGWMALGQLSRLRNSDLPIDSAQGGQWPEDSVPRNQGHRLAWTGITLSVISLGMAAIAYLYLRPRG